MRPSTFNAVRRLVWGALAALLLAPGGATLRAQDLQLYGLFVGGGGPAFNDVYTLRATVGQAAAGVLRNATYTLGAGFWYQTRDRVAVAVEDAAAGLEDIPTDYVLEANYPNPFNPSTTIPYGLPEPGPVRVEVFDILGRRVQVLVDREQPAGFHTVQWDARTAAGSDAPSGLYLVRLTAASRVRTRTMTLLR